MKFNGTIAGECRTATVTKAEADPLIRRHYLQSWPGVTVLRLGLFYREELVGIIVYALPPRETAKRYGGVTWELARLWVDDKMPTNTETWFIARSVKYIKGNHREVTVLVSYADPGAEHQGTIYKAANWVSDGRTDQERKTPRVDYFVNGKKYSRWSHTHNRNKIPEDAVIERRPRISKFRFIYRLRPVIVVDTGRVR